jgi:nucleoside-diphosphate-sugar epimerase
MRGINALGNRTASLLGWLLGSELVEQRARKLFGAVDRQTGFRFREPTHLSDKEVRARIEKLQREARARLEARGRNPRLHVLLTGATGFLGKELLVQAAAEPGIERVVAVVRPEKLRDPKTREVVGALSPQQRGAKLLERLGIRGARARKFRFVQGDIEQPQLGIGPEEQASLRGVLTHVIHCAASVSFDDSYANSYRANVVGCRNALAFSLGVQQAPGSVFVEHVAIETSYVHGRKKASMASEEALSFPRHFYNNFYELTKAMASIETDRFMVEEGLRVAQLLPSIVIGDSRTGNNRGDTKVVNAPVNAFGRVKRALGAVSYSSWGERLRTSLVGVLGTFFPADPSAELNLVTVDRVAAGILAALTAPEATGARIHLATDRRIRSEEMARIIRDELEIDVRMADPTLTRVVTLPLAKALLGALGEHKLAQAFERLGALFGSYSEWGQPIHDVGEDVAILALPARRPDSVEAFRMMCRHSEFVQEFGTVRDPEEIARRERLWERVIDEIEFGTGRPAASLPAREFRRLIEARIELPAFKERPEW